jgi:8-oxo-dGTP pyrophosphatase MutT (NUDIX family)
MVEPRPAATVVLVREARTDLEVLLLRRDENLAFTPGCWVFPGGKIDPQDYPSESGTGEYQAALRAAVRETREEAGITIDHRHLIHTAHWTTPENLPLRFSTWFFLCPLYEQVEVTVDDGEIRDFRWISPVRALQEVARRELKVIHPTLVTLQDLRHYSSLDELLAGVSGQGIRVFPDDSPHYRPIEMGVADVPDSE